MLKNNVFLSKEASVSTEASIVFFVIITIMVIALNSLVSYSNKNKLEHLSYTIASLARESSLYDDEFSDDNANELFELAKKLSKDYIKNEEDLAITIRINDNDNYKDYKLGECEIDKNVDDVLSEFNYLIVGICVENRVLFGKVPDFFNKKIKVFSLVAKR